MKKDGNAVKFFIADTVKTTLIALIVSLILILLFAFIVKAAGIGENVITPVNYVIKFISILVGAILGISRKKDGALKGAAAGALYILAAFTVFSLLGGGFDGARFNFIDLAGGIVSGAICGVIAVNFKKEVRVSKARV
ncbi:MAG: TIGR04086 family membrane protein [Clostridiaceae bacterium]|jgi:putative membrane protein (TIGR04086 family)|nr:TIGR04086 family membrane protein [Clostridiaceae bacterium]